MLLCTQKNKWQCITKSIGNIVINITLKQNPKKMIWATVVVAMNHRIK